MCVAAPYNEDQRTADGDYLTFGGAHSFVISESWDAMTCSRLP
jgi:hypothetical protein